MAPTIERRIKSLGMTTKDQSLVPALDALANWRQSLARELSSLTKFFTSNDLLSAPSADIAESLRQRLLADKLVVAFVAEFSRGKSELINAIFFADTGRRILPASPGRTTMCPVELALGRQGAADARPAADRHAPRRLVADRAARHARGLEARAARSVRTPRRWPTSLSEVTHTRKVTPDVARELGLWSDTDPEDNPPLDEDGLVEVPAWRHAMINYPHPLLARGLVVLDTPGLNAIGTEPELTLGLLPGAHAALFLLGADAGVTKSDLSVWNEHLGGQSMACFVVLNKVDMLADPLLTDDAERGAGAEAVRGHRADAADAARPRVPGLGPHRAARAPEQQRGRPREEPPARARSGAHQRAAARAPAGADACAGAGRRAAARAGQRAPARPAPPELRTTARAARPARQERRARAPPARSRAGRRRRIRALRHAPDRAARGADAPAARHAEPAVVRAHPRRGQGTAGRAELRLAAPRRAPGLPGHVRQAAPRAVRLRGHHRRGARDAAGHVPPAQRRVRLLAVDRAAARARATIARISRPSSAATTATSA